MSVKVATSFELIAPLGDGATARVWRARDASGTELVLKVGRNAASATALATEAIYSALALSPRLPELRDLGVCELDEGKKRARASHRGLPFLTLGWRDGIALTDAPRGEATVRAVAAGAGEALADLHELGLAHGDVKPANVILGEGGAGLIDLGLAGDAYALHGPSGTPRYLGRGDRQLGDARARDLLALGIVLAELADDEVRRADEPLAVARRVKVSGPVAAIAAALLSPDPGARPSASWVCRAAGHRAAAGADRHARRLRASYLRLRRSELGRGHCEGAAPWLAEALELAGRARAMCRALGVEPPAIAGSPENAGELPLSRATAGERVLAPLDPERRLRWLVSLAGPAAASWSGAVMTASEPELCRALAKLCHRAPEAWTLADVEAALAGAHPRAPFAVDDAAIDAALVGRLALAVARTPADAEALEAIERLAARLPEELVVRAADALRLAGELGRARALLDDRPAGAALHADILRRAGDIDRARALAEPVVREGRDHDGRARACLARIELDAGEPAKAAARVAGASHAAELEVAALAAMQLGDTALAAGLAERGYAVALTDEARARLAATIAFVHHSRDSRRARELFDAAAVHAVHAGAVLEEASYRTGVAAASVDVGELEAAEAAARRAALLFDDVLARPALAARAWLARAAAWAAVDGVQETLAAAAEAIDRARAGGDAKAEAYAHWTIADVVPAADPRGAHAATRAATLVAEAVRDLGGDGVHALARLLRHDPRAAGDTARIDAAADQAGTFARLAWWGARAERALAGGDAEDVRRVLDALAALTDLPAPAATRGKTMALAARLAAGAGDAARRERFDAARRAAADAVLPNVRGLLAEAARSCRWLEQREGAPLPAHHQVDLQQLVRALGERDDLDALLAKVVDALILWTGAERGLFLLRKKDGKLVPRAARNLARRDLAGEQLAVSLSLAERALAEGEPVVAVDAMAELSQSHASVHTLELRSVLVLPLYARGEVVGVVYLDDRFRKGAFGQRELAWATTAAPIAAVAIADARTQSALRRAVKKAESAKAELALALAHKESALAVAETELARSKTRRTRFRYDEIIGESEPILGMLALVDRLAASEVPVLLQGESGSGKELVARAIHRSSSRAERPFVGENCGALPETLLESALFGHVRGAFTGAHETRIGLYEAADSGTLFLDEVGEMSLAMQTKLLRVLEDGVVRPVGSERSRKVDVRVVAATHRDLEKMVAASTFREDLYYRLNVITVRIPALRERQSDIPLLVQHLIQKHAQGRRVRLTPAARRALGAHPWPGNIRQLENEVRRALLLCEDVIDLEHLSIQPDARPSGEEVGLDVRGRKDQLERELVREALGKTRGNQTQAAKLLGLSRFGLHKLMKRLSIDPTKAAR